jgi:hypothetical protein
MLELELVLVPVLVAVVLLPSLDVCEGGVYPARRFWVLPA